MKTVDLNSDIGEGFGPWKIGDDVAEEIMPLISSANIATGFHAGDPNIMNHMVQFAKECQVKIGAHPGYRDLVGFGRRPIKAPASELVNDMIYQLGALREFAKLHNLPLQHIKPHGALYMHLASNEEAAYQFVRTIHALDPELFIFCMPHSMTFNVAKEIGQPVIREFYADREYDLSGSIVFTRHVKALDPTKIAQRALRACQQGLVKTINNEDLAIEFDSICIHSDTPGALALVQTTRSLLETAGIKIQAPK